MLFLGIELFLFTVAIGCYLLSIQSKLVDNTACLLSAKIRTIYLDIVFIFVFILVSFRSADVGNDTEAYLRLFNEIVSSEDLSSFLVRFEIGYVYLNKLVALFTSNAQAVIIVTGFITTIGYYFFIKKYSKITWLSVIMFFLLRYLDQSMNTIRQSIAIVILLYAYDFLVKKKALPFFVLVIIAFFFHNTAIVFLLSWYIVKFPFTKLTLWSFGGIAFILYVGFDYLFSFLVSFFPIYIYYVDGAYLGDTRIASVLNAMLFGSFVIFVLLTRKVVGNYSFRNSKNEQMTILLFVGLLVTIISFKFNLFDRIAVYFNVFSIVLVPNVLSLIRNRDVRFFIQIFIVLLLSVYYFCIITYRPDWNRVYPYTFFLNWN